MKNQRPAIKVSSLTIRDILNVTVAPVVNTVWDIIEDGIIPVVTSGGFLAGSVMVAPIIILAFAM